MDEMPSWTLISSHTEMLDSCNGCVHYYAFIPLNLGVCKIKDDDICYCFHRYMTQPVIVSFSHDFSLNLNVFFQFYYVNFCLKHWNYHIYCIIHFNRNLSYNLKVISNYNCCLKHTWNYYKNCCLYEGKLKSILYNAFLLNHVWNFPTTYVTMYVLLFCFHFTV